jgi:eukaryotic-like serine/threonine-protein kinase
MTERSSPTPEAWSGAKGTNLDVPDDWFLHLECFETSLQQGGDDTPDSWLATHPEISFAIRPNLEAVWWLYHKEAKDTLPSKPPEIPGYKILAELNRGGMGVVFVARQLRPRRVVALKMSLIDGAARPGNLIRFRKEPEAVARLQHPNIVQILEFAEHEGRPYFTMEYLAGGTLAQKLADSPLPADEAARLVHSLAWAVQAAHEQGIVHRDLKPANVLFATDGTPKITDFGLARQLLDGDPRQTHSGDLVGTPSYMAPEQARGSLSDVGPATDTYALGIILYECLTGRPPFKAASVPATLGLIQNQEPVAPSRLSPKLPRDLETICLKCLEKEPSRRYASARALADDLNRFLNSKPILARPVGPFVRAVRWAKRRPVATTLLTFTVVAGVAGVWGIGEVVSARRQADANKKLANTHSYYALVSGVAERGADPRPGWTWQALADIREAAALDTDARDPVRLRSLAARCLAATDVRPVATLAEGINAFCLAFSPDGRRLAIGPHSGLGTCSVLEYDVAARRLVNKLAIPSSTTETRQTGVRALAFSPDGRWLAAGTRNGELHIWDMTAAVPQCKFWRAHQAEITCLAFRPDGRLLVSCSTDKAVAVWRVADGQELARYDTGLEGISLAFRPDGAEVLCGATVPSGQGNLIGTRRMAWGDEELALTIVHYPHVAYSSDRRTVASSRVDGLLYLAHGSAGLSEGDWSLYEPGVRLAHEDELRHVEFVKQGTLVVSAGADRTVKVWDVPSGRLRTNLTVNGTGNVFATGPAGGGLLAVTDDNRTLLYEVAGQNVLTTLAPYRHPVRAITWSHDGALLGIGWPEMKWNLPQPMQTLVWEGVDRRLQYRPPATGPYRWQNNHGIFVAAHPAGGAIVCGTEGEKGLQVWSDRASAWREIGSPELSAAAVFSPDGHTLWSGVAENAEVIAWRWPELTVASRWSNAAAQATRGNMRIHAIAAGRRWVLAGSRDRYVKLLRSSDGQLEREWPGAGGSVQRVALSPDETWAAAGTEHGRIQLARLPGGEVKAEVAAHTGSITALAFHPDGRRLLTASASDTKVCLWDLNGSSLRELITLPTTGPVVAAEFSPDGNQLAVLVRDERAPRIWHLDRLQDRLADMGLGRLSGTR